MEEVTIEAAVSGDYGKAIQAFTINPLVRSGKLARVVLNQMLLANKDYLPQFKNAIEKIEQEGETYNPEEYGIV